YWNPSCLGRAKDQLIPALQSLDRQSQAAELVFAIGVGTGDVADQVWRELAQAGAERVVEPAEVVVIGDAVGQVHVNRGRWLPCRVVVLLMKRDGEDLSGMSSAHERTSSQKRGAA